MKRRRLSDLYVVGKEITFDDGQGAPITIWLQKINSVEHDSCMRRAAAARAAHLASRKNKESEEYKAIYGEVTDFANRETLIDLIIREELSQRRLRIEAEIGAEAEWSDDEYLQGLYDSWNDGLKDDYARNPDDPEAKRVFEELKRFTMAVEKAVEGERKALLKDYESTSEEELHERAVEFFIKHTASTAFMDEYDLQQIYYATRLPEKHTQRYFETIDEIRALASEVKEKLFEEYRNLTVGVVEGKSLEETPTSSPSSEPSEQEETANSSGLQVVSN